ncbi:phosphoribosylanthranilate isomerase [Winogradskyella sp. APC 3343]|uniref:N-(5'-phosphoribosyl)anthranilate isomerase n=1 Tax=Winogradskyella bathintestinalis TaxID=3035208 RepID=A0ABT7ZUE2_9FLAO|nr:phosphoribosylanthranilate isomerase [Winogradskyella bathintestinalis]MDN3492592.1 phosphoribosylanthranilate isomerase [Winogradskyella bathintestinalis]
MKYKDNMEAVANLQPNYLGFIFYNKSTRYFDSVIPTLPKSIKKVGVFVNEDMNSVIEMITKFNLQAVQLHGEESPEYCEQLKRQYEESNNEITSPKVTDNHDSIKKSNQIATLEIIKVFSIKDEFNFEVLQPYENHCDYFLFDTKGKLPGGNGYTFNWSVLNSYPSKKPYFLSGGIGINEAEKVKEFIKSPASKYCYALDVNSKFEIEPGLKNIEKLKTFIQEIKT